MNVLLGQRPDLLNAIAQAKTVALSAYVLPAENAVVRALAVAADRGARVVVTLDGSPYFGKAGNGAPNPNANCAAVLRAHGATVRLSDAADPAVHLKAAVVDGRAFLDDRNWPASGHETVVETDDPAAVDAITAAIDGHANSQPGLALQKAAALALEAATIRMAGGDRIDVATESFGTSIVSVALCERARAGAAVRLAVNARVLAGDVHGRERAALARLRACGVAIEAVTTVCHRRRRRVAWLRKCDRKRWRHARLGRPQRRRAPRRYPRNGIRDGVVARRPRRPASRAEKGGRRCGRARRQFADPQPEQFGNERRRGGHVGGLVAPAAVRDRREIRAVGLQDDRIDADRANGFANVVRRLEGHDATDPKAQAEFRDQHARLGCIASEAMDDAPQRGRGVVAQRRDEIVEGIALVEDGRIAGGERVAELRGEHGALDVARAVIVVIVQTHLADRARRPLGSGDERVESRRDIGGCVDRFVRMDADRVVEPARKRDTLRPGAIGEIGADGHDAFDARRPRARQHLVAIAIVRFGVDVRVRVEHIARMVARMRIAKTIRFEKRAKPVAAVPYPFVHPN